MLLLLLLVLLLLLLFCILTILTILTTLTILEHTHGIYRTYTRLPASLTRKPTRHLAALCHVQIAVPQLDSNPRPRLSWRRTGGPASAGGEPEAPPQLESNRGPASAGVAPLPNAISVSLCCNSSWTHSQGMPYRSRVRTARSHMRSHMHASYSQATMFHRPLSFTLRIHRPHFLS